MVIITEILKLYEKKVARKVSKPKRPDMKVTPIRKLPKKDRFAGLCNSF